MNPDRFKELSAIMWNEFEDKAFKGPSPDRRLLIPAFRNRFYVAAATQAIKFYITLFRDRPPHEVVAMLRRRSLEALHYKAAEYAHNGDRLWNFKKAAELRGCSPEEACQMFALKHLVSMFDILDGNLDRRYAEEKFGDFVSYQILGIACQEDEMELNHEN